MIIDNIDSIQMKQKYFQKIAGIRLLHSKLEIPLHRAHVEMTIKSMEELSAKLFLHPVVGMTKPGDVDHHTRVRCYQHVIKKIP